MTRTELRVAVIEDDADIAFTIRVNLEREGYAVSTFSNGHEGLVGVAPAHDAVGSASARAASR